MTDSQLLRLRHIADTADTFVVPMLSHMHGRNNPEDRHLYEHAVKRALLSSKHNIRNRMHEMATPAFRGIRASYDDDCITVYQAYNASIAEAAVKAQKLSASPLYRPGRATWIKPSWCWMMYRSGYSYKDSNQERILAIRMKHENFAKLLRNACVAGAPHARGESVVIQWDPERGPRLEKLGYRSIQIGIPGAVRDRWIEEWIESIEDVTQTARDMKRKLDEDPDVGAEELVNLGLMPNEQLYKVEDEIFTRLEMGRPP